MFFAVLLVNSVQSWAPLGVTPRISLQSLSRRCYPQRPSSLQCESSVVGDCEKGLADSSDTTTAFSRWLETAGVQSWIALADFNGLRGAMTVCDISQGEAFLAFPRSTTMDLRTAEECPCSDLVDPSYWETAPWFLQLGLWLVAEEQKGSSSPWAAYIATLPREVDSVLDWTTEELGILFSLPLSSIQAIFLLLALCSWLSCMHASVHKECVGL